MPRRKKQTGAGHRGRPSMLMSVGPLEGLTALETLSLEGCYNVANVDALKRLDKLKSLDLSKFPNGRHFRGLGQLRNRRFSAKISLRLPSCLPLAALRSC